MILTPLIDIDNLDPTSGTIYILKVFVVIDDKGREIVHKDKWKDSERGEKQRYKWSKDISDKGEEK